MARIVAVPKFNTILKDDARKHYSPVTDTLWAFFGWEPFHYNFASLVERKERSS